MILGIGCDIVETKRIHKLYESRPEQFLSKIYSKAEQLKFKENNSIAYLAKRFAAKEAVAKALGQGIGELAFNEIEILNNEKGAPFVNILKSGYEHLIFHISLSDEKTLAIAYAVIEK